MAVVKKLIFWCQDRLQLANLWAAPCIGPTTAFISEAKSVLNKHTSHGVDLLYPTNTIR